MDLESLSIQIARSEHLPAMPESLMAMLRLSENSPDAAKAIVRIIERDAALTARLLKVANSALYGNSNIRSVGQAVTVLGMKAVRTLSINLSFQRAVTNRQHSQLFDRPQFWLHSLTVATASRMIAESVWKDNAEEMYVAGLLHDVGFPVMDRFASSELDLSIRVSQEKNAPIHRVEQLLFSCDHSQVGALLASRWSIPGLAAVAIEHHHDPLAAGADAKAPAIVAVANHLAHLQIPASIGANVSEDLPEIVIEEAGLTREQLPELQEMLTVELAAESIQLSVAA